MPLDKLSRILFINPISRLTGAEVTLLELMEHLPPNRFLPYLLCPDEGPLTEAAREKNIQTIILPSLPVGGRAVDNYRSLPINTFKIAQVTRQFKIDLVHSNTPSAVYHGGAGARLAGAPSLMHVRDYRQRPFTSRAKCWFLNSICDRVIVVSLAAKEAISPHVEELARKGDVIYDGIPPAAVISSDQIRSIQFEFGRSICVTCFPSGIGSLLFYIFLKE